MKNVCGIFIHATVMQRLFIESRPVVIRSSRKYSGSAASIPSCGFAYVVLNIYH